MQFFRLAMTAPGHAHSTDRGGGKALTERVAAPDEHKLVAWCVFAHDCANYALYSTVLFTV